MVVISPDGIHIRDVDAGEEREPQVMELDWRLEQAELGE